MSAFWTLRLSSKKPFSRAPALPPRAPGLARGPRGGAASEELKRPPPPGELMPSGLPENELPPPFIRPVSGPRILSPPCPLPPWEDSSNRLNRLTAAPLPVPVQLRGSFKDKAHVHFVSSPPLALEGPPCHNVSITTISSGPACVNNVRLSSVCATFARAYAPDMLAQAPLLLLWLRRLWT